MIFTAFFDESDTDQKNPNIIMAGFLGHQYQWKIFNRNLKNLQQNYGFKIFHATDFNANTGEFKRWSPEKKAGIINDLTILVRDTLTEGLTITLEHERYLKEYREPPVPKKMHLDSQYGLCFRACLGHVMDIVYSKGKQHKLHIVVENGHKNVRDVIRIFDEVKRNSNSQNLKMLETITIATKEDEMPLMVADFLARTYSMMRISAKNNFMDYEKEAPKPTKGHAGLSFLEFQPNALKVLKENFEKNRQEKKEKWQAKRHTNK